MFKNFTSNLTKTVALVAMALVAANAQAQDEKLYLSDVATEAELTEDICGVPMLIDNLGNYQYRARYYNSAANTPIYFLLSKDSFSSAYGLDGGELSMGAVSELDPIILPEANTYYEILLDTDNFTYSLSTYTVEDYMDPVFFEIGDLCLNTWDSWESHENGEWVAKEDAWWQEFKLGFSTGPGYVVPFTKDAANPHLYYTTDLIHFEEGLLEKIDPENGEVSYDDLSFIVHNWHSHGWWNYVTWRVDDEAECDIWYYYGYLVKPEYLDWAFGEGTDYEAWVGGEGYRKEVLYNGEDDAWAQPDTNGVTGDYRLIFDSHLGRGKLVPFANWTPSGITSIVAETAKLTINGRVLSFNEPVRDVKLYNMSGMSVGLKSTGNNSYYADVQRGIYVASYTTGNGVQATSKVVIR